jgi:hypothetical protein
MRRRGRGRGGGYVNVMVAGCMCHNGGDVVLLLAYYDAIAMCMYVDGVRDYCRASCQVICVMM